MLKSRKFLLSVIACSLVILLAMQTPTSTAAVGWSDDFNDGNYDGWTVEEGSFTAVGNSLNTTGTSTDNSISHNSTAAFGFWSFDIYINESEGSLYEPRWSSAFIRVGAWPGDPDAYVLEIWSDETAVLQILRLVRVDAGELGPVLADDTTSISSIHGWQAVNITRSLAGEFEVFLNGTSYLQCTDLTYTTSEYFVLAMTKNSMFDDLVVSETEIHPLLPIPMELILIGVGVAVVVIVIIVVFVYRRRTP
ncbi:MAG: hypothetical protein ACFE8O_03390 [Candidatus Hermodarchaeota archaeon]